MRFTGSRGDLHPAMEIEPFDVVDAIIRRGQATIDLERALAAQGIEPQRSWVADGVVEEEAAELRWVADNRASLTP